MRRILSLTLALVMVLGTFAGVFAAEAEITPAEFLKEVGVLEGDDGDLMLDKTLLRRDSVILLSRLMGSEDVAEDFPGAEDILTFEDITDAYYNGYLAWAVSNKLFEGHDEATFGFNENVTAQDYATVLLRALGYEMDDAAWAKALETAKELEILADVEVENKTEITRDQMAVMTYNALKAEMKDSSQTLAEKLGIEMPEAPKAKELTAKVNDTENLKEVVVELSNADLADALKLESLSNYRLSGERTIESVKVVGDDVVLLIENTLVKGREYTLTIRGIDRAINGDYKFKAYDNTAPTVESVEVLGEYGIKVTTSEPVRKPLERDILIDGKRVSMEVEQYGRDIIVRPYHERSFDKDARTLEIVDMKDYAGYSTGLIKEDIEIVNDDVAPEVVSVVRTRNTVTVVFDKDIYEPSVAGDQSTRNRGNISYRDGRTTVYAEKIESDDEYGKIGTNVAKYQFYKEFPRNVEFTIEGIENHSKVKMDRVSIIPEESKDDEEAVVINNDKRHAIKIYADEAELTVKFDKDVYIAQVNENMTKEQALAENLKYFTLYEKEIHSRSEVKNAINNVEYKDGKYDQLLITFNATEDESAKNKVIKNNSKKDFDYILEISDIYGRNDNTRMYRNYIDFEVVKAKEFFVATGLSNDDQKLPTSNVYAYRYDDGDSVEIIIYFNDKLDREAALDARNYFIDGDDLDELGGYAILDRSGKRVSLIVPEAYVDFDDNLDLEIIKRVTNLDGDRLSDPELTIIKR